MGRTDDDVDPELAGAVLELARRFGNRAVLDAAREIARRPQQGNATRAEMERIAELILKLPRASAAAFNPHAFIQKEIGAGIPAQITIEILERIVEVGPANPWALVNTIMAQDYPAYKWGRG
jgi:hypothetical protein